MSKLASMKIEQPASDLEKAAQNFANNDPEVKLTVRVRESFRDKFKMMSLQRKRDMQDIVVDALQAQYPELRD